MRTYLYSLFILCVTFTSCTEATNNNNITDNILLDIHECENITLHYDSIEYSIIELDNNPKCQINSLDKMVYTENGIYIMSGGDETNLYHFANDGKFLGAIGRKGHSKQEYTRIMNFNANKTGDTIAIIDNVGSSIKLYNGQGKFINMIKADDDLIWDDIMLLDNKFYTFSYRHGCSQVLTVYDNDFSLIKYIGKYDPKLIRECGFINNYIQSSSDYICVLDYFKSEFYLINKNNDKIKKYVLKSEINNSSENAKIQHGIAMLNNIEQYEFTGDKIYIQANIGDNVKQLFIDVKKNKLYNVENNLPWGYSEEYENGTYFLYLSQGDLEDIMKYHFPNDEMIESRNDYIRAKLNLTNENVSKYMNGCILKTKIHE